MGEREFHRRFRMSQRSPTIEDVSRLLSISQQRGFPRMLGSLDCMHWKWKNCPTTWAKQFTGRSGSPTIILEAVSDYDLWIWHAYFEMPGINNDISVLKSSNLLFKIAQAYTSNEDTSAKSFTGNAGREFHRRRRRGELYRRRRGIELHQRHRGRELYQRRSGRELHRRRNEVDKTEISVHRWSMSFISVLPELLVALSVFFFLHNNRSPEQKCQTKK
uniref:Nuclease HARBI1 n=1 Tax=Brassica oleracea var. oleracea TaxID=109376 RepID=A0A0D3CGH0_BRAOL